MVQETQAADGERIEEMAAEVASGLGLKTEEAAPPPVSATDGPADDEKGQVPPTQEDTAAPAGESAPVPAAPAAPVTPAPTAPPAPDTWSAPAKEKWTALDPVVQQEITKRETDVLKGIGQYREGAEVGSRFYHTVLPHGDAYMKAGASIWDVTKEAIDAHAMLSFGSPQQKITTLREIAQKAGVDLQLLVTGQAGQPDPRDAELQQLRADVQALRQGFGTVTEEVQNQQLDKLTKEVEAFAADKQAHPYFMDVAMDMKQLLDSNQSTTVQDAYDKAVWLNPITRQKEIDRIAAERRQNREKEAAEEAKKVKKVKAVNVSSRESSRGVASPVGTIDDTLTEALAEIKSRH